jgi:prepilin signal peptidase PulO-like enzyme (type II secretory pathway)
VIPDKLMFPSIIGLGILLALEEQLSWQDAMAVVIVVTVFLIPVVTGLAFGGGDLRFGAFGALFTGLEGIGYFLMFAGLAHLVIAAAARQKVFPFAPAMSIGALAAYGVIHA